MNNNELLDYLPEQYELSFNQGCYYSLTSILKLISDEHTQIIIKNELSKVYLKLEKHYNKA